MAVQQSLVLTGPLIGSSPKGRPYLDHQVTMPRVTVISVPDAIIGGADLEVGVKSFETIYYAVQQVRQSWSTGSFTKYTILLQPQYN